METKKIPLINEKFEITIFLHLLNKSKWIIALIIALIIASTIIYIRYTKPLYQSTAIIQLNTDNNPNSEILQLENINDNSNAENTIELLKSKEFLTRVFSSLPLKISYYNKGTFLSEELFENSGFTVDANVIDNTIYDVPIFIDFKNNKTYTISYTIGNKESKFECSTNKKFSNDKFSIVTKISDYLSVQKKQNEINNNSFYFIINNPNNIYKNISKNLRIELLNSLANTISISLSDFNAAKTSVIVNKIASEFINYDIERKQKSAKKILEFIDDQTKSVYQQLIETENNIQTFKKDNNIKNDEKSIENNPFPIFTGKIDEFNNEISNIEVELITLKRIKKEFYEKQEINLYDVISTLSNTKSEAVMVSIINNIQALTNTKNQLLNDITENNRKIKLVEKQIDNQKTILIDFIESTIARFTEQKNKYKTKISDYEKKIFSNTGYNEVELSRLNRLYSINEEFYDKLISKKAEYLISQAGFVSKNEILELSQTPNYPISPIKSKIIFIFSLAGIIILIIVVTTRYLLYNNITSEMDIQNYTSAPIIGSVPIYREKIPVSQLLIHKNINSSFAEAFRKIRSNMDFLGDTSKKYSIAISSTVSGEGKTFVALNLGEILALSGKKVIVIDMDLRKPRIHLGFNVSNEIGMSTILSGKNTIKECTRSTEAVNIDYITAGPVPPNPSELTMSLKMDEVLAELKEIYDIILIDTSPIGLVTDALNIFNKADFPIYVTKAGYSKRVYLHNINHLINDKNIKKLSVVLNGAEMYTSKYGYGYGYGYGNNYGYYYHDKTKRKARFSKLFLSNKTKH